MTQVTESLYELYKPAGTPRQQILFFHGLQLHNYSDAHLLTWESADGSCIWPQEWLVEEFAHAHVLTVSYSAAIEKCSQVRMDMYNVGENLVSDLMQYGIGQIPSCPVILVGHSLGGLVIKQVLCQAHTRKNLSQGLARQLEMFLDSVRGVFYYATPHHGSDYANKLANIVNGPLLTFFRTLSTDAARLNQEFNDLSKLHERWRFAGLGETLPTRLPKILGSKEVFIVQEASARGDDFNLKDGVDHFTISKPRGKNFRNFYKLQKFILDIDNVGKILDDVVSFGVSQNLVGNWTTCQDVHLCQGFPRYSVLLEERGREVQKKLRDADVLGIVGMGGIGKTTTARHVFNAISKEFEYTCFVDNVKGIPVHKLQNFLLDNFYWSGQRIVGRKISWLDLERRKILLVMDDVDSESQLKVLPQLKAFGVGSRLIITTRDEGILSFFERCQRYRVDLLKDNLAERLFCQYAGLEDILDNSTGKEQMKRNVKFMVRKCEGLPLSLEVLGCYMRGHVNDANYWEQTIDKLGKAEPISGKRNDRVWDTLRVGYDGLGAKEQNMFIEAGTYFFGQPLDRALAAWNGAHKNAETRWADLKNRSMVNIRIVKKVYGSEYKTVWVHEQLRDLAESLAKDYMVSPCSEGDLDRTALDALNADEVYGNTKIVRLHNQKRTKHLAINSDFLTKLRNLKYLDVNRVSPEGLMQSFPKDLSLLTWNLRYMPMSLFPQIGHKGLSNLAVLELDNWEVSTEFPEALGNLCNLRILSLRNLRGLNHLPENFGNLSQLKQLELSDLDLQDLPANFGYLSALEELTLRLPQLKCLPNNMFSLGQLVSLQKMTISCETLRNLPDSLEKLTRLEYMHLTVPEVKALPESLGQLSALRYLSATIDTAFLPESFGQLSELRTLYIHSKRLQKLPDSIGKLPAIRTLILNCDTLETLEGLGDLSRLETFELRTASLLSIPESIGELCLLTYLTIYSTSLRNFPVSLGKLSRLKKLRTRCDSLEMLPDIFENLSSLTNLEIRSDSLRNYPASLGKCSALKKLHITCHFLETLPDIFGNLSSLTNLEIYSDRLRNLPASLGKCSALKQLVISCPALETLPDIFGNLSSLTNLEVYSDRLRNFPASLGKCCALKALDIGCDSLETLPDAFGNLSSLETLDIRARSLLSMPESIGQLSSLQYLFVNAANIRNLPRSFAQLSALRYLSYDNLEKLPDSFADLSSLVDMEIPANSLDSVQEELLASLGWELLRGHRVSPPRGLCELLLDCLPFAGLSRQSVAPSDALLYYRRRRAGMGIVPEQRIRRLFHRVYHSSN